MANGATLSRRAFLARSAATTGLLATPSILRASAREIRIGYITALSGPRAEFGASDPWMLEQIQQITRAGLTIGGNNYSVEFLMRDNQSNANRSATVGQELIQREGVNLLLVEDLDASVATGEMSDTAGVPSICTMGPWQAWMFGRGSNPEQGFPYSFTFFWGADGAMSTFTRIWDQISTNKVVGDFYLDSPAGQAFANPDLGLPGFMSKAGYSRTEGGMFQLETHDFSAQVSKFKEAGAQIVTGFGFPPHWSTFWAQAGQLGYTPEAATFAAAFLFPSAIEAMGDRGNGLSTEVWWTPDVPFASSLTGQSAAELAKAWEDHSGAQWVYALFGLGLSLIFGVMKIANIAHGEMVIAGAFLAFTLAGAVAVPLWLLVPVVAVVMFAVGYGVQATLVNRVLGADPLPPLLLTFGISIIAQNLLVEIYGADNRGLDAGGLATAGIEIGGLSIGVLPLLTLGLTVALFGALHWAIGHTRWGRIVRATSDAPAFVGLFGVKRNRVFATVMGLSAALAALAGMLLAMRNSVTPFSGVKRLLIAFEVIVIGGLGSIWAGLLGGLALGLVHVISFRLDPASGLLYGHLLLLVILLARPEGLAGRKVTR